jgi:alpha-beta hydrolase superfamily lysophospholipase
MATDNVQVHVRRWLPAGTPKAAVLVAHGMAEHGGRYARFAEALTQHGYAVYAPDHRGHGETAGAEQLGRGGPDAWNGTLRDLARLADDIRREHPGIPLFFFGHSMGSILAQRFTQLHGDLLAGTILSGTFGVLDNADATIALAEQAAAAGGDDTPSALAGGMFASFNTRFAPERTGFEWLSRDEAEVQRYVDDPYSGFAFSNGLLRDHLRGWAETFAPENEKKLPASLPFLIFSGEEDPVGRDTLSVRALAERYRELGVHDLTLTFYPGGRHEMLNETNRDDVTRDIITWLDAHVE